jgi:hypothetical protein
MMIAAQIYNLLRKIAALRNGCASRSVLLHSTWSSQWTTEWSTPQRFVALLNRGIKGGAHGKQIGLGVWHGECSTNSQLAPQWLCFAQRAATQHKK